MDTTRQQQLAEFVDWAAKHIRGDEKGQAQIFLDRLFQAFGQPGVFEVGGQTEYRIRKGKEDGGGTAFADYVWKPVVLIEMKKRGQNLAKHYRQAFEYWVRLAPHRPKYVVLCNFDEFWVYDFDSAQIDTPLDTVKLKELPEKWGPLAFLFPNDEKPVFGNDHEAVTREAADHLAACFNKLIARKIERPLAQRFILQMLISLFAEDIGLLQQYTVTQLLSDCHSPRDAYDLLGGLFVEMNTPGRTPGGRYKGVGYFNGGLFADPARIELTLDELSLLKNAATKNWSQVRPEIFGTLFEHSLGHEARHAFGAHYTAPVDIMKIIGPTITQPWQAAIEGAKTRTKLRELLERLQHFRVLDPACGSGNFLYLAYREMKRLEARLKERLQEFPSSKGDKAQRSFGFVTAAQFYGLDINPFAIELAKVTMMIARKLAIDELHVTEPALPLDNLDKNFIVGDALIDTHGHPTAWPAVDVIIGNPPFLGAKRLKPEHGPKYVNAVRRVYPDVPGMADYCVYWFRKTHDHLPACTLKDPLAGRAGLVGTQNIRSNQSRVGGLDHIAASGTIIDAVDNQPWSGEANVHVSIANWIKSQDENVVPSQRRLWFPVAPLHGAKTARKRGSGPASKEYLLDYRDIESINSALSYKTDVSRARLLSCNRKPQCVFQGVTPGYDGFVLSPEERNAILKKDPKASQFIRPYLIGRELVSSDGRPKRFLIDFFDRTILDLPISHPIQKQMESEVLPDVMKKVEEAMTSNADMVSAREDHLNRWWTFWAQRAELRKWMSGHARIIAASRTQRIPFAYEFISTTILPGDKLQLFGFDDDYSFAIIQSSPHGLWYERRGARLKNEADYNYSSASVFDTFPWPQKPTVKQIDAVAKVGARSAAGAGRGTHQNDGRSPGCLQNAGTPRCESVERRSRRARRSCFRGIRL